MADSARLLIHSIHGVTIATFQDISILDTVQVEQIGEDLYELVDTRDCKKLVLDFSTVRFLSSSALGVLITLQKKAKAIKGQIVLCGLRNDLRKVFQITRLEKMFTFCRTEEEALATFGVTTGG